MSISYFGYVIFFKPAKHENAATPPPTKPVMTEEEVEKKSKAIIEEYLHINDSKVPMLHSSHFGLTFFSKHLADN